MVSAARLFGRDRELEQLAALFESGARLVTIHGFAGVGKTTLARAFAKDWVECDLSEVRELEHARHAIAASLGVDDGVIDSERLRALVRERAPRLVLDGFEQVLPDGEALVADLLRDESIYLLVTSRRLLKTPEEHRLALSPLPRDDADALLQARVSALGLKQPLDPTARSTLYRFTEGLPLATELIAARLLLMTPEELVQRLQSQPGLASTLDSTATLRRFVDSLPGSLRDALVQCAAFDAPFDLDSALDVLRVEGEPLDVLQALVESSMLRREQTGSRLTMFLALREILRPGLSEEVMARHARCALAQAGRLAPRRDAFVRAELAIALERSPTHSERRAHLALALEPWLANESSPAEHASLLAGWIADAQQVDASAAVRLGLRRVEALVLDGDLATAERELDELAARGEPGTGAAVERTRATLARRRGNHEQARLALERGIPLADELERPFLYREMAVTFLMEANENEAETWFRRALQGHAEVGQRSAEARVRSDIGTLLLERGDDANARVELDAAAAIHASLGDIRRQAIAESNLGALAHQTGDLERAASLWQTSAETHRRVANRRFLAFALGGLAAVEHERGSLEQAAAHLAEAETLFVELGDIAYLGWVVSRRAALRFETHDAQSSAAEFLRARKLLSEVPARWWTEGLTTLECIGSSDSPLQPRHSSAGRIAARLVEAARRRRVHGRGLVVARNGHSFELNGVQVSLASKPVLARMLWTLVEHRVQGLGALMVPELVAAVWPGEKLLEKSAASRVYTSVRALRRLGLAELLITSEGGYRLSPQIDVHIREISDSEMI